MRAEVTYAFGIDRAGNVSPLMLADRLIALAAAADRSGHIQCAGQLLSLAFEVLDDAPDVSSWSTRAA